MMPSVGELPVFLQASGESRKLYPLTENLPSAMVPALNQPVMTYPLELLARQGIKKYLVGLYAFGGSIEAYFGSGRRWGVELEYVLQREPWGSAGVLKLAASRLRSPFLVVPADAIIDFDLEKLLDEHISSGACATVVVSRVNGDDGNRLAVDDQGFVTGLELLSGPAGWVDTGVYLLDPQVLDFIPARTKFDIHQDLLPALVQNGWKVRAHFEEGYCNLLGTLKEYQQAQEAFLAHFYQSGRGRDNSALPRYALYKARQAMKGVWIGNGSSIHPEAQIIPPVYIGQNSRIGKGVELGPYTVVGSNVVIDQGATVRCSTILDHTYVGQYVRLQDRVVQQNQVIDVRTSSSIQIADDFLLSRVPAAFTERGLKRIFDAGLALLLLLVTLPLTLPLALLLWLTSGRVFYGVPVVWGHNAEQTAFNLYQFATRDNHGCLTKMGRLLEKLEWHRLPELINVLRGDLNLVGVKPLSPTEAEKIVEAWQEKRNDCRPGITGLWYTQAAGKSELEEILIADVYYVVMRSWQEDLKILSQTPQVWWRRVWH